MKRFRTLSVVLAALGLSLFASCDLEVKDFLTDLKMDMSSIYVALGGEDVSLTLVNAKKNGSEIEIKSLKGDTYKKNDVYTPGRWTEFNGSSCQLSAGDTAEFEFRVAAKTGATSAYQTWLIAFYDGTQKCFNALRSDTWINPVLTEYSRGIWSTGGCAANMTYQNGYDYLTSGNQLTKDQLIRVVVSYDGTNATILAYDGDTLMLENVTSDWSGKIIDANDEGGAD